MRPCLKCGVPTETSYCPEHQPASAPKKNKPSREALGYGGPWRRLSLRARKMQPFCSDCGTVEDLTCDHSPEAWRRYEAGLPIRLQDVDVVCRRCNSKRGAARGENPTWGVLLTGQPSVSPSASRAVFRATPARRVTSDGPRSAQTAIAPCSV